MLGAIVATGLAVAALARYRPVYFLPRWNVAHDVVLTCLVDPIRLRVHGTLAATKRARDLWTLDQENQRLRHDLALLNGSNQVLREQLGRVERLTGLGRWGGPPDIVFLPANVIGLDTYAGAILVIDRGSRDGVRARDPVVSLGGLAGIVRSVSARSATVQSVTDPLSVVGAVGVTRSGRRARGVVYGRGLGQPMEFAPESEVDPIEPGATLISSGFDNSVFPKGLAIGVIEKRGLDPYGLPIGVTRPAVSMREVEDVLVVMPRERGAAGKLEPAFAVVDAPTSPGRSFQLAMPPSAPLAEDALASSTRKVITAASVTLPHGVAATTLSAPNPAATASLASRANGQAAPPGASHESRPPAVSLPMVVLPTPSLRSVQKPEPPVPSVDAFNERRDAPSEEAPGGNP
jgi:rod shape-determining protein MreC